MPQDFKHHAKYYVPHHFLFYPAGLVALVWAVRSAVQDGKHHWLWIAIATTVAGLLWLSFMLRQHYALTCQDRLIRLELRLRYYILTQKRMEPIEHQLSTKQMVALRFASDEELPTLVQRAVDENLSAGAIKRAVRDWQPDHMRV